MIGRKSNCYIFGAGEYFGDPPSVGRADLVIAADGGYEYLLSAGLRTDLLVGDFDSLTIQPSNVTHGANTAAIPCENDNTDVVTMVSENDDTDVATMASENDNVATISKEALINCLSPDTSMDLAHGTGKKRRDTGGITRLFAKAMRQIGGVYGGRVINHRFPNVQTIVLPREKDDTDMVAAIRAGKERGFRIFHIYGGTGDRLDHTLANMQCLADLANRGARGYLYGNGVVITAITNDSIAFDETAHGMISVFSHTEIARGVFLTGLKYPLTDATISNTYPIGVSNEFIGAPAMISVREGTLIVVFPQGARVSPG